MVLFPSEEAIIKINLLKLVWATHANSCCTVCFIKSRSLLPNLTFSSKLHWGLLLILKGTEPSRFWCCIHSWLLNPCNVSEEHNQSCSATTAQGTWPMKAPEIIRLTFNYHFSSYLCIPLSRARYPYYTKPSIWKCRCHLPTSVVCCEVFMMKTYFILWCYINKQSIINNHFYLTGVMSYGLLSLWKKTCT